MLPRNLLFSRRRPLHVALMACAWLAWAGVAQAQESPGDSADDGSRTEQSAPENFALHGQGTYIWQQKPVFPSPYSGANSLLGTRETSDSASITLDLGLRLWPGAELHLNPEVTQGVPFSGLHGLGGLTNGELAKVSAPTPTTSLARAFVRQTWALGDETEAQAADFNQLAGRVSTRRLVLTAGKLSVLDIFDRGDDGHDPRAQFFNWSFLTHGSFDYAADARGYTWGAALEFINLAPGFSARIGRFAQPLQSNGMALDDAIFQHYGDALELEKRYDLTPDQPGVVRLLLWRNKARMGAFDDALRWGVQNSSAPDVAQVREEHTKIGGGLSIEQALSSSVSLFAGMGLSDDRTETYAFTEVGRDATLGALIKGTAWGRAQDMLGLGFAINGLSRAHRDYLAAGGMGAFLGDGQLRYGTERIIELFYSLQLNPLLSISPDFQFIHNPGYNRDRGPVRVYGLRLHVAF